MASSSSMGSSNCDTRQLLKSHFRPRDRTLVLPKFLRTSTTDSSETKYNVEIIIGNRIDGLETHVELKYKSLSRFLLWFMQK